MAPRKGGRFRFVWARGALPKVPRFLYVRESAVGLPGLAAAHHLVRTACAVSRGETPPWAWQNATSWCGKTLQFELNRAEPSQFRLSQGRDVSFLGAPQRPDGASSAGRSDLRCAFDQPRKTSTTPAAMHAAAAARVRLIFSPKKARPIPSAISTPAARLKASNTLTTI